MSQAFKLTKDPIWFLLRKVTIPASVGSLFQTFYNLVDTWFAGRISAEAIAAIAKSFPIYFTIIAIGAGLTAGTTPLTTLDIDGGTDIGAAVSATDLIIVDDGAGGTNRKAALSRVTTLTDASATALAIALG